MIAAPVTAVRSTETGVVYCDENLERLTRFESESVDLIYLDPPFFSNRNYEVIWGDEAEVRSFEDRWDRGIEWYVEWMKDRVREMHRILKPSGAMFLHCDWHAGHYLKVMADEIFGSSNFRNEIVWHYKFRMMRNKRILNRKHDTIFFYAKSEQHRIEPPTEPWTREEIIRVRKQAIYVDPKTGREWVWMPGGKGRSKNKPKFLDEIIAEGKAMDDVWDMPIVSSSAKERLGYPTQKPEALLERIIAMSSKPGDVVLDPFAGCGTTLVSAHRLGRKWIGIDISPTAVELMKRRMTLVGAAVRDDGLPQTEEQLRALKPFEFQNWVIQRFNGTHAPRKTADMGIDGYSFLEHLPIQVKQSDHVGRPEVDAFQTAVERTGKHKGYMVGFRFTRGAYTEVIAAKKRKGLDIQLVEVADLLKTIPDLDRVPTPTHEQMIRDLLRPADARPSADQLVVSDQREGVG